MRCRGNPRRRVFLTIPLLSTDSVLAPLTEGKGENLRQSGFVNKRAARPWDENTATDLLGTKRSKQELDLSHLTRIRSNFWAFQGKRPNFGSNPGLVVSGGRSRANCRPVSQGSCLFRASPG